MNFAPSFTEKLLERHKDFVDDNVDPTLVFTTPMKH